MLTSSFRSAARRRRVAIAVLVPLLALAACGGDDDGDDAGAGGTAAATSADAGTVASGSAPDTTAAGSGEDADVDPNGVLRVAANLDLPGAGGVRFDPTTSATSGDFEWIQLVFGTLLRDNTEGTLDPWMAESYEVIDPQTVKLTVREGITFTDGTPYDAEAVRAGLLRTRDQASEATKAGQHTGFKTLDTITVDSPLELTITLNAPAASEFLNSLANREGAIVSPAQAAQPPGAIDAHPIGAGPYMFDELRPAQVLSLRKNPDFFDADAWRLGGIDYLHTPDGPAGVTGLRAGAVDVATVPDASLEAVEGDDRYLIHSGSTDFAYIALVMCTGKPPLDDIRVRQAMQAVVDRDNLNQLVYNGRAAPAYGLWPEGHANFNPEVTELAVADPDRARALLDEAGVDEVTIDLHLVQGTNYDRLAQVLQAQFAEVGMNLNIIVTRNIVAEFIEPQRPGMMMIPGSRQRIDKYARVFAAGSVQALCGVTHPEIVDVVAPTAAMRPDDPAVADAYHQAELMVAENANPLPLVYAPSHMAFDTERVGGTPEFNPARNDLRLDSIYVRAS